MAWPGGKAKRYVPPSAKERIRLIELRWYLPAAAGGQDTAISLLEGLRRLCPECQPLRFGNFEPLQVKLEPGSDDPFLTAWSATAATAAGDMLFWKGTPPCFSGSVSFPDRRQDAPGHCRKPTRAARAITISVSLHGRAAHADSCWRETYVRLFVEMAGRLGPF